MARKKWKLEWADIIRDLDNLVEMEVAINGKGYVFHKVLDLREIRID